jgi:hypothetical protein
MDPRGGGERASRCFQHPRAPAGPTPGSPAGAHPTPARRSRSSQRPPEGVGGSPAAPPGPPGRAWLRGAGGVLAGSLCQPGLVGAAAVRRARGRSMAGWTSSSATSGCEPDHPGRMAACGAGGRCRSLLGCSVCLRRSHEVPEYLASTGCAVACYRPDEMLVGWRSSTWRSSTWRCDGLGQWSAGSGSRPRRSYSSIAPPMRRRWRRNV